jgi:hypothetical protein
MERSRHEARPPARASSLYWILARCARDTRGAVFSEYVILVGVVALVCCSSLIYLGVKLADDFNRSRAYVVYPVP